ncbi:MAG: chloride channel protein [Coriobacteriia bacterium]|nr:chloride channel protein [Coriobacteriia bacterium]
MDRPGLRGDVIVKSTLETLKARAYQLRSWHHLYKWSVLGGLTGVLGGLAAVAFVWMLEAVESGVIVASAALPTPWLLPLVPAVGGLVVGLLRARFTPEAFDSPGSTDRAIDAIHDSGGRLPKRTALMTAITSAITLGTGGSAGREGPTVLIGAGIGSLTTRIVTRLALPRRMRFTFTEEDVRVLAICGIAAGLGAVFRAPIGAALFAVGVLYIYGMEDDFLAPALVSSLTSFVVFSLFHGFEPMFRAPFVWNLDVFDIAVVLVIGVLASVVGIAYIRTFYTLFERFRAWSAPVWLKPALGGLAVGVIGLALPHTLGMGHGTIQDIIDYRLGAGVLAMLVAAKIVATSLTIGSGGAGGDMAPALVIGAALGGLVGAAVEALFPGAASNPALYVIAGMGAVYASVAKVPLATAILLCESTRNYTLIVPLVIANTTASLASGNSTIYKSQHASATREQQDVLRRVPVGRICTADPVTVLATTSVIGLLRLVGATRHHGFPVLGEEGGLVGVVSWKDAQKVPHAERDATTVAEVMSTPAITVTPVDPARRALDLIEQHRIGRVVVVDAGNPDTVLGVVTKEDLIKAYAGIAPSD